MKITKKLYNILLKSHRLSIKHRDNAKVIEEEMEKAGFDLDRITNDDLPLVNFTDYGAYCTKEEIEEKLEDYVLAVDSVQKEKLE